MSDPVKPNAGENQNQPAPGNQNPDGQAPAAPVVEPPKVDPAPAAPAIDPSAPPAVEPPKAEPVYELKKADGSLVDASEAEKIVSFSKEHGLSPAQAQAIYNRENAVLSSTKSAFEADAVKQYEAQKLQWIEEGKANPVFGGEHFAQNVQAAHLELKKYASPSFIKLLDDTGFGNHPALLEVFFNIHKANQDDVSVRQGQPPSERKHTKDVLYDNSNQ